MELMSIVNKIDDLDLLEDNENLSIPCFDDKDGKSILCFFSYSVIYGKNLGEKEYFVGKLISWDGKELKVEKIQKQYKEEKDEVLFKGVENKQEFSEYSELVDKTQRMIDQDFNKDDVIAFAEAANSSISAGLCTVYRELMSWYIDFINCKL